jgi:predicted Fe-S protein YdhL (DUF1289 family)
MFDTAEEANDLRNLTVLCAQCHRHEESRFKWVKLDDGGGVMRINAGGAIWQLARERGMV